MQILIAYVAAGGVFLGLDMIWLGYVARNLYRVQMGDLVAPQFLVAPAALFYALYLGGIVYFAIQPALRTGVWHHAILPGALLGLVAYGTYDLTNLAVIRNWPPALSFIDMFWGALLTALAATAGASVAIRFG